MMSHRNHSVSHDEYSTSDSEYYPSDSESCSDGECYTSDGEYHPSDSESCSDGECYTSDSEYSISDSENEIVQLVESMSVKDSTSRSRKTSPSNLTALASITSNEVEDLARTFATLATTTSHSSSRITCPTTPPPKLLLSNETRSFSSQSAPVYRTTVEHRPYQHSSSASTTPVPNRRLPVLAEADLELRSALHNTMGLGASPNTPERKQARQPHVEDFDFLQLAAVYARDDWVKKQNFLYYPRLLSRTCDCAQRAKRAVAAYAAEVFDTADDKSAEYAAKKYAALHLGGKSIIYAQPQRLATEDKIAKYADRVYGDAADDADAYANDVYNLAVDDHTGPGCPRQPFCPLDGDSGGLGVFPRQNTLKGILDYIDGRLPLPTQYRLFLKIVTPLSKEEMDGYIYVIDVKNPVTPNLTHLKVGRSGVRMTRIHHWRTHYGYGNTTLRGLTPGLNTKRLEALIHIELTAHAISMLEPTSMNRKPCTRCGIKHQEVFSFKTDTYETIVKPTIRKWTKFVETFYQ